MKPYIKTYLQYFGLGEQDVILCEVCESRANDIHHIKYKSQGGVNDIMNLIALCRYCHELAHAENLTDGYLVKKHLEFMNNNPY